MRARARGRGSAAGGRETQTLCRGCLSQNGKRCGRETPAERTLVKGRVICAGKITIDDLLNAGVTHILGKPIISQLEMKI